MKIRFYRLENFGGHWTFCVATDTKGTICGNAKSLEDAFNNCMAACETFPEDETIRGKLADGRLKP